MKYIKQFLWVLSVFAFTMTNAFAVVDENSTAYQQGRMIGKIFTIIFVLLIIHRIYKYFKEN
ncbi:hypothetical protein BGI40_04260 [Snodgrassella communis]|jgi:hypothetical protein|uniref:Uncharacterized protein n=1 Tax=Snodgrassella communis TaxID=2946699 RepID=A0A836Z2I1_9NEIS|nr:hypothetical protein SALWKB29_2097 [Snodgrassella communis]PIT06789.1 hypothetical protein BGI31_10600 [Snodgrassella communis]PIT11213.1 hypothetical protein BGI29_00890 [Snodgrassella communis]PIT27026.1 hypothetical protein BGI38_05970 [Snodgrassella communis]PIT30063.1 hypothetical protein BGI39_01250 [Snodgrassella communis]